MLLEEAYDYLKKIKLVGSHRDFSTDFLSRRPRHYDDLICSGRKPSPTVLASLAVRLGDVVHQKKQDPYATEQVAELDRLIGQTFLELRKCFVSVLPRKRPAMNILSRVFK